MPIIQAENDVLPNKNAELLEDEQPENRTEGSPIENCESAPLTPPSPLSSVQEIVVSEGLLISNAAEEPITHSGRPVRLHQALNRLSCYGPGQAYSVQASPLNTVNNTAGVICITQVA